MMRKIPLGVWMGLGLAIVLDTIVQITWKAAVMHVPAGADIPRTLLGTFHQPLFLLTFVLFAFQFVNWMVVLGKADLSYALPITAISYISVSVCAAFQLHEVISWQRMGGIALILAGVVFISSTPHKTTQGGKRVAPLLAPSEGTA